MSKIITTSYLNETKFYQMPKAFFHNPLYMDMKNESKIAYMLLRDLLSLSIKYKWINENDEVYVKLSRDKMMKYLQIKKDKHAAVMKELVSKELIVKRRVGLNQVDEIYICIPEELNEIYSNEELLEYEEDDKKECSNVDFSRKSEKPTSGSLKNRPQEIYKTDLKKSIKPTHTNTNIINTNIINNKSSISNTSSKGEISPLVNLFNKNICELKKTTLPKFKAYEEKYDSNFIEAIIKYGADTNAKSYKWFETTIESYIAKNMLTAEEVEQHIKEYHEENRQAKNRALKQKEEKRKLSEEAHKRDLAGYDALDEIVADYDDLIIYDTENGEVVNNLKNMLQDEISEVQFNTWIKPSNFVKLDNKIIIECPNRLTVNAIERSCYEAMINALRQNNIQERVVLSIKKEI